MDPRVKPGGDSGACCGRLELYLLSTRLSRRRAAEAVVERVARAADGADRVSLAAAVERLAQPADMDVDGALVDIDLRAPHRVEQLGARKHPAGPFHQEFEQPVFSRAKG